MSLPERSGYSTRVTRIPGTDPVAFQWEICNETEDYAVVKIAPKQEELDSAEYTPAEATLSLLISRNRYYDCFVDLSLNRLSDPAVPVFVQYLRGDGAPVPKWKVAYKDGSDPYKTALDYDPDTGLFVISDYAAITSLGGYAIKMKNRTGSETVKGQVVRISASETRAFNICGLGTGLGDITMDPIGVVYESGIANESYAWIVHNGAAEVLFCNTPSLRNFVRVANYSDSGAVAGYAWAEAAPVNPAATDKHFQEIGHCMQSRTTPGLALCILHQN